ncbi:MAG: DUF2752 domain-containing protein [Myxococcales bacterium]|nr:DUF2752 domain-containing protein [Myxococcales bacterium]
MTLLRRLDELTRGARFGHLVLLVICATIVVLAAVLTPTDAVVSVFGYEIPVLCGFRRLTGIPCPGCGLTRSFVYLAHGHPIDAFRMNVFGPFLFAYVAGQVPYRAWLLWRGGDRVRRPAASERRPAA